MADSPYILDITSENFEALVIDQSYSLPVLVDFWADWCNPCKVLMPILAKLVDEVQGRFLLAKVNTEEQQSLAVSQGVRSLPTVRLYKGGQAVDEFMGALPEPEVRGFLDTHIPRASDKLLTEAQAMIEQGQIEQAMQRVESAHRTDSDNPRVQVAYARIKAIQGEIDEAQSIIDRLPMEEREKPEIVALRAQLQFDKAAATAAPEQTLVDRIEAKPGDSEAYYQLAALRVMDKEYEAALELLFTLMQRDRSFGDDAARKGMLAVFDILGGSGALVSRYRTRMFNALH